MTNGVLVLAGPPCAGKSAVRQALAADPSQRGRIYLEVDALFRLLNPHSDRSRHDRMLAYDAAHTLARMLLERGHTPVLECTYARREQRVSLTNAIAELPWAPLWVVELSVTPEDAIQRFRGRDDDTDLDEESLRERVEAFAYSELALRLASSEPPSVLADRVTTWLRAGPTPIPRHAWAEAGRAWD